MTSSKILTLCAALSFAAIPAQAWAAPEDPASVVRCKKADVAVARQSLGIVLEDSAYDKTRHDPDQIGWVSMALNEASFRLYNLDYTTALVFLTGIEKGWTLAALGNGYGEKFENFLKTFRTDFEWDNMSQWGGYVGQRRTVTDRYLNLLVFEDFKRGDEGYKSFTYKVQIVDLIAGKRYREYAPSYEEITSKKNRATVQKAVLKARKEDSLCTAVLGTKPFSVTSQEYTDYSVEAASEAFNAYREFDRY